MIGALWKALQAGEELKNPAMWKRGAILSNAVGGVVAGVIALLKWQFPEIEIPEPVRDYAIEVISGALVVINIYLIPATTKKVGA